LNSKIKDGLLDRAVDAHGGLERWREVLYLALAGQTDF